jgi:flavin reductase (DIM6/NTAB) family NADH-FMN oxidoreductase RutF
MINFKDAMSQISNTVSIIALATNHKDQEVSAVTISSLFSTSVEEGYEEIVFVLKANSFMAQNMNSETQFSINVLTQEQRDLAVRYGGSVDDSLDSLWKKDSIWTDQNNYPRIHEAKVFMKCFVTGNIARRNCVLVFAKVIDATYATDTLPLLHFQRKYVGIQSFS